MADERTKQQLIRTLETAEKNRLQQKADVFIQKQNLYELSNEFFGNITNKTFENRAEYDAVYNKEFGEKFWQNNSRPNKNLAMVNGQKTDIKVSDMDFYIAESLQKLQSGQSPEAEYADWVLQEQKLGEKMAHNETIREAKGDMKECREFITFMDDRETELKRVIALYAGAALNSSCEQQGLAQHKLKFLLFKLSELRRLRERAQNMRPDRPKSLERADNNLKKQALSPRYIPTNNQDEEEDNNVNNQDNLFDISSDQMLAGHVANMAILGQLNEAHSLQGQLSNNMRYEDYATQPTENSEEKTSRLESARRKWEERIQMLRGLRDEKPVTVRPQGFSQQRFHQLVYDMEYD